MERFQQRTAPECPAALVTEAEQGWALMIEMLRTRGEMQPVSGLYRYDAVRDVLTLVGEVVLASPLRDDDKLSFSAAIRQAIKHLGADCLFFAADTWCSPGGFPGRREEAPDRRECLLLQIELRNGDCWLASQYYSRVAGRILIPDVMPELQHQPAQAAAGLMQNWWSPTPVVMNN